MSFSIWSRRSSDLSWLRIARVLGCSWEHSSVNKGLFTVVDEMSMAATPAWALAFFTVSLLKSGSFNSIVSLYKADLRPLLTRCPWTRHKSEVLSQICLSSGRLYVTWHGLCRLSWSNCHKCRAAKAASHLTLNPVLGSYLAGPMDLYLHWLLTLYALWTTRYVMVDTRQVHNSVWPWPTINQIANSKHYASCTCHSVTPYITSYCHLLTKTVRLLTGVRYGMLSFCWYLHPN